MHQDQGQEAALDHSWDQAPEGIETGPRVTVTLPDQQPLVGQLLEQRQGSAGDWFCLVALSVWEHVRVQDEDAAQATTIIPRFLHAMWSVWRASGTSMSPPAGTRTPAPGTAKHPELRSRASGSSTCPPAAATSST